MAREDKIGNYPSNKGKIENYPASEGKINGWIWIFYFIANVRNVYHLRFGNVLSDHQKTNTAFLMKLDYQSAQLYR